MAQPGGVDQLVEKWLADPSFRARMERDPEGTVQSYGITLTAEECTLSSLEINLQFPLTQVSPAFPTIKVAKNILPNQRAINAFFAKQQP